MSTHEMIQNAGRSICNRQDNRSEVQSTLRQEMYQPIYKIGNEKKKHIARRNSDSNCQLCRMNRQSIQERSKSTSFMCTTFPKSNDQFVQRLDLNHELLRKVTEVGLKCDIETRKKIARRHSYPFKVRTTERLNIYESSTSFEGLTDIDKRLEDTKKSMAEDNTLHFVDGWIEPKNYSSPSNQQERRKYKPLEMKSMLQKFIFSKAQQDTKMSDEVEGCHISRTTLLGKAHARAGHKNAELSCVNNFAKLA